MSLGGDQGSPLFSVSLNILPRFPHDLDKVQLWLRGSKVGTYSMVAETGFEPRDLRVMSPTSYQAAPLRDI